MLFGDVNENGKLDEEDAVLIGNVSSSDVSSCKYTDEWAWYYYSIIGDFIGDESCDAGDSSMLDYYLLNKDSENILDFARPYYGVYWYEDILNAFHNDIIL